MRGCTTSSASAITGPIEPQKPSASFSAPLSLIRKLAEAHLNLAYAHQLLHQASAAHEEYATACKLDATSVNSCLRIDSRAKLLAFTSLPSQHSLLAARSHSLGFRPLSFRIGLLS